MVITQTGNYRPFIAETDCILKISRRIGHFSVIDNSTFVCLDIVSVPFKARNEFMPTEFPTVLIFNALHTRMIAYRSSAGTENNATSRSIIVEITEPARRRSTFFEIVRQSNIVINSSVISRLITVMIGIRNMHCH